MSNLNHDNSLYSHQQFNLRISPNISSHHPRFKPYFGLNLKRVVVSSWLQQGASYVVPDLNVAAFLPTVFFMKRCLVEFIILWRNKWLLSSKFSDRVISLLDSLHLTVWTFVVIFTVKLIRIQNQAIVYSQVWVTIACVRWKLVGRLLHLRLT